MQTVVDALWEALHRTGISWAGFYLKADDAEEMTLGPRRDKPACSPIGLHGACGRAWRERRPLVVADVAALGPGYIACDPRDRSEVVLPVFDPVGGACWGVLDLDSHDVGSFSEADVHGLQEVLERAGLSSRQDWRGRITVLG